MVPMIEPPLSYAKIETVRNDTACFNALVDPMPGSQQDKMQFCKTVPHITLIKVPHKLFDTLFRGNGREKWRQYLVFIESEFFSGF